MKAFMSSNHDGRFVGTCGLIGLPLRPALSIAEVQAHSARGAMQEARAILAESEPQGAPSCVVYGHDDEFQCHDIIRYDRGLAERLAEALSSFLES